MKIYNVKSDCNSNYWVVAESIEQALKKVKKVLSRGEQSKEVTLAGTVDVP